MATDDTQPGDLVEERPAPGVLLRHGDAAISVYPLPSGPVAVGVQRGAVWLRCRPGCSGIVVTHGATTVEMGVGAAVVEARELDALLVVVAGQVAVRGAADEAREVPAGHAVALRLDGTLAEPGEVTPHQLAAQRMIGVNLALDARGSALPTSGRTGPPPAPHPTPAPAEPGVVTSPPGHVAPPDSAAPPDHVAPPDHAALRPDGRSRRRLLVGLVAASCVVVVVALAFVLPGSDVGRAGPATDIPPDVRTEVVRCRPGGNGYEVGGTLAGGGERVANYDIAVVVVDGEGEVYGEGTQRVVAAEDPGRPVEFEASVPLAVAARPDTECRITEVQPRDSPP